MRGEGGVAGAGRVVGVPKFHSWSKRAMPLTNINSDWMRNASSGLCINLHYIILFTQVLYFASWGVMTYMPMCLGKRGTPQHKLEMDI